MTKTPQVGKPVKRGAGWFVPSRQVGYHVERIEGRWRCCCPSFRWGKTGRGFQPSSDTSSSWLPLIQNLANRAMVRSTIPLDFETMIDLRLKRPNQ
jgi:hypothetical protein